MRMIDMLKSLDARNSFLLSIGLLISADVVILLNILILRQILGFLFLTILPGLLILQILKLNKIGLIEKFVLSVGLSISFLMFFGLLINNLSLSLSHETPLATIPLLISFNIVLIVLAIIGYKTNKEPIFSLPNLNLTTSEKAFLIVPVIFPALSIFGMHVMNTADNNIILMFLLFLIPIYVVFVCLLNRKFPKRLYPVVIFLISISLLLLMALRSNHILGCDTHEEYYFFQTTLNNLHWNVFSRSVLDACLSISLLPTVYQSILNIPSEYLFKILYSLIYSISPLVIYIISKKYVGESYAFLAACFFMSQCLFLETSANSRASIAILFFALAMMTLSNDKIDPLKKRILFIVFMVSCMVSHYSTAYIFFFILLGSFLAIEALSKKYTFKKVLSLTIVILFFAMIFFWYSQVTGTAFNYGVRFVGDTLSDLNRFFVEEVRGEEVPELFGRGLLQKEIPYMMSFFTLWMTFIFIGIGILSVVRRYKEMSFPELNFKKADFLKEKFEIEYFVIALVCSGLLVAMIALPYVTTGYETTKLYAVVLVLLSPFFVIGGIIISKHFFFLQKKTCAKRKSIDQTASQNPLRKSVARENAAQVRAYLIILLVLIPYFLCTTGVIYQISGSPNKVTLNSEGKYYDTLYVHDQESCAAKWLKEYNKDKIGIYTTDIYIGRYRLMTLGDISPDLVDVWSFANNRTCDGYIYLGYYNVVDGKLFRSWEESYNLSDYSHQFIGKNKIYANGGAEVYR